MSEDSISLNKFISNLGICSRRQADSFIQEGRVTLNGRIAKKGNRVIKGDEVLLDGKKLNIKSEPKKIYLAFHKPPGITSTTDLRDPRNILDYINYHTRIFPIGRLDNASSGLILLTNDGDIVNKVLRKENNHEKEYIVSVSKEISSQFLKSMAKGVPILGTITKPAKINKINKKTFSITLTQGLNRQIRRMCEYLGYRVVTLKRIRIMHIDLGSLPIGKYRELNREEKILLFQKTHFDIK